MFDKNYYTMIEKVNAHQIQNFPDTKSPRLPVNGAPFNGNDADVMVRIDSASFIDKAMKIPQTDAQAVEKAKKLLLSGELENPANFLKAAENIVNFGI